MNKRIKEETHVKQNKGITLIALVITIIVMLILVVVTVNIAMDGGLFTKAKDAGDKTTVESEKETLTNVVLGTYDGTTASVKLTSTNTEDKTTVEWNLKNGETKDKWQNTQILTIGGEKILFTQGKQSGKWYEVRGSGTIKEALCENNKLTVIIIKKDDSGNKTEENHEIIMNSTGDSIILKENTIADENSKKMTLNKNLNMDSFENLGSKYLWNEITVFGRQEPLIYKCGSKTLTVHTSESSSGGYLNVLVDVDNQTYLYCCDNDALNERARLAFAAEELGCWHYKSNELVAGSYGDVILYKKLDEMPVFEGDWKVDETSITDGNDWIIKLNILVEVNDK